MIKLLQMSKPKKIVIATGIYPPEIGGPATYTVLLEKELPVLGYSVEVLPFRTVSHLPKVIRNIAYFFKMLLVAHKADVLYSQDPVSTGIPTLCAAKFLGKPFIMRVPGDYAWEQAVQHYGVMDSPEVFQTRQYNLKIEFLRFLEKFSAKYADYVITPSIVFRDLVRGWVNDKEKIVHIYNGVDFSGIPTFEGQIQTKTLISAGRLVKNKGFDVLIKMLTKLPEWTLFIVGEGPEIKNLLAISESLGLSDRVIFLGSMPRRDLLLKIQESEIFILNTVFETFSFQVVEAMHCGTPVITTSVGSLPEIIENGKEGILVEPNNEEALLTAIEKIHSDKLFRDEIIKNAMEKAKYFSVESVVKKTAEVMDKALML